MTLLCLKTECDLFHTIPVLIYQKTASQNRPKINSGQLPWRKNIKPLPRERKKNKEASKRAHGSEVAVPLPLGIAATTAAALPLRSVAFVKVSNCFETIPTCAYMQPLAIIFVVFRSCLPACLPACQPACRSICAYIVSLVCMLGWP